MSDKPRGSSSSGRTASLLSALSQGGLRAHVTSLLVLALGSAFAIGAYFVLRTRASDRQRTAFNAAAAPLAANLRSAFALPLEVLSAITALVESSQEVTRAEFARFVRPALER